MGEIATPSQHRLKNQQSTCRAKHGKDDSSNSLAGYYPEGGWGYVVVVAAFFALMTQMGIIVSMGVYLEHIEKEFHAGAGIGGWISSGCFAVLALSSPVAGHTMQHIGCRATAMIGGAIMCSGFVCGMFASSVLQLFMFADVVAGFGGSLTHISATVVVGQYFNRRYALANCFAYTGQGIGIMIFPPILQTLIETYGWRGCMLIQGALTLHISVAASLYRPVRKPRARVHNQSQLRRLRDTQKDVYRTAEEVSEKNRTSNSRPSDYMLDKSDQTTFTDEFDDPPRAAPGGETPTSRFADEVVQTDFPDEPVESNTVSDNTSGSTTASSVDSIVHLTEVGVQTKFTNEENLARFLAKEDQFLDGGSRGPWQCLRRLCRQKCGGVSAASLVFIYAVFVFETFGYGGFFAHIVAKGGEIGGTEGQATWALSIFGVGSLTGRITHGWILDRKILSPRTVNALSLVISGGASVLVAVVDTMPGVLAGAFFAGLGSGWYLPLQQVLLRNVVGQSRLHLAYGYGLAFEGIGSLAGGIVIGYIRDVTGSYVLAYCFLGFVFMLGVAVFIMDCFFEKKRSSVQDLRVDLKSEQPTRETVV
ncbi:monocarboxylate transporter 13-like isoform X1 [Asterias amurensis]|uniref:monocarboxylate transporter 13-like isoform X1 n=2 Tax=Asterias amurensis TaxID=7602 RepID=UPI003AB77B79